MNTRNPSPAKTAFHTIIYLSLSIAIAEQISIHLFDNLSSRIEMFSDFANLESFRLMLGAVAFPVTVLIHGPYPILPVTVIATIFSYLLHGLSTFFATGSPEAFLAYPEAVFMLSYGFLLYLYCKAEKYTLTGSSAFILILIDYISNALELFVRIGESSFTSSLQAPIFFIAIMRALIFFVLYLIMKKYRIQVITHEESERYQNMLFIITRLGEERTWIEKCKVSIESLMNRAYTLYQKKILSGPPTEETRELLDIANQIHEIKKEYNLVLRGLSEAFDENRLDDGMKLDQILNAVELATSRSMSDGRELNITYDLEEIFFTRRHYQMISIFRNLVTNAIEAADGDIINIHIHDCFKDDKVVFEITDDGSGIPPENLNLIFNAGFSTKINYETGEVSRGLGLNLLYSLITEDWNGDITVTSRPGKTTFTIQIPKQLLIS